MTTSRPCRSNLQSPHHPDATAAFAWPKKSLSWSNHIHPVPDQRWRTDHQLYDQVSRWPTVGRGCSEVVAILFKDSYQCQQVSFGNFTLFEYLCILLIFSPCIPLATIYRPLRHSAWHLLKELRELLSVTCTDLYSPNSWWLQHSHWKTKERWLHKLT